MTTRYDNLRGGTKNRIVMVSAYRHKLNAMDLKEQPWEEAWVHNKVEHPQFRVCLVGSFIAGIGMYNVFFPIESVRPCTEGEVARLTTTRVYRSSFAPDFKLDSAFFATQSYIEAMPIADYREFV